MTRRTVFLMLLCLLVVATPAFAQSNAEDIEAGNIQPLEFERPFLEYICAGVFLFAALAIGFKPSKRVHDA